MKGQKALSMINLGVFILMFLCIKTGFGQFEDYRYLKTEETLEGIKKLRVVIGLNEKDVPIGLTTGRLRTVTELRLRREGIEIVNEGDMGLYINVDVTSRAASIGIEIQETVIIPRLKAMAAGDQSPRNYQKFLQLWKDTDPSMTEVEDTRKKLAGVMTPENQDTFFRKLR